jgi:protein SCO1/2
VTVRVPLPALISACLGGMCCAVGAMYMLQRAAPRDERRASAVQLDLQIPPFSLIDQDGQPQDQSLLEGELTLVSFVFTNCPGLCPIMTSTAAEAQRRLSDTGLRLASFSLDAERDSPEAMRAFAERHGADLSNWVLLTGDTLATRRIVAEGLRLIVQDETQNQVPVAGGGTMPNILHPTRLVLVGPDRRVLGFYSVSDVSELDRLEADVRAWFAR